MIIAVSWTATAQGASVVPVAVPAQAPPSGPQLPASLTLSSAGAAFIASFEGFGATPYDAPYPVRDCVIGYGHVIHSGLCTSADFETWGRITAQQGQALLQSDIDATFVPAIRAGIPATPLTQPEFDALVDWVYNEGPVYIAVRSSVRSALRATPPHYSSVAQDLMRYVFASGRKLCGLYRRRVSEVDLWSTGSYARLSPACPPGYESLPASPGREISVSRETSAGRRSS
jgi:lysozyme